MFLQLPDDDGQQYRNVNVNGMNNIHIQEIGKIFGVEKELEFLYVIKIHQLVYMHIYLYR